MNDTSDLLVTAPVPRKSDDAFARAVAADVAAVRKKRVGLFGLSFAVPTTAAAAFAVMMAVTPSTTTTTTTPSPKTTSPIAVVMPSGSAEIADDLALATLVDLVDVLDDADDSTLLALAGNDRSAGAAFAFAELDGSSDQELADVEAALDSALRQL